MDLSGLDLVTAMSRPSPLAAGSGIGSNTAGTITAQPMFIQRQSCTRGLPARFCGRGAESTVWALAGLCRADDGA